MVSTSSSTALPTSQANSINKASVASLGWTVVYTTQGDVLDEIAKKHLGSDALVTRLYAANPGLVSYGAVLPAGLAVRLPRARPSGTVRPAQALRLRLW